MLRLRRYEGIQVEGVIPTNHSSCQKTRMNDVSCGVRIWAYVSLVLLQSTRFTDGPNNLRNTVRCITCSRTVKIKAAKRIRKKALFCVNRHTVVLKWKPGFSLFPQISILCEGVVCFDCLKFGVMLLMCCVLLF